MPVPRLDEQRRIVAILDEAFEGIATAKANAGKNSQNARELFASRTQILFGQDEGWEGVQLAELLARGWITSHLDGNHGSDYPRKEEFVDAGVPYIAASAIKGGTVDFDEAKYLSPQRAATIRKGRAKDRDVLFAHNATVGPVAILSTDEDVVILGTSLTYYRCNPQNIHPEYLAHFMSSPAFTSQYAQVMKQSTRNQVPITKQREFFHVIPPIDAQRRIADDLDELSTQTERLAAVAARKVIALEELKNALLHESFSGGLSVTNVLLLEYDKKQDLKKVQTAIKKRAELLKTDDGREQDKHWLLIYQTWTIAELKGNRQGFLAKLKGQGFEFFAMHAKALEKAPTAAVSIKPPSPPPQDPAPMATVV